MPARILLVVWSWLAVGWMTAAPLFAADQGKINSAIGRGRGYLGGQLKDLSGGRKSLAAYALIKTGSNPAEPGIQEALKEAVKEAQIYAGGSNPPGADEGFSHREFAYTVACHMFLLEAADPVQYKPQLTSMTNFLCEQQLSNGSWCYVNAPHSDAGDTSQMQFVLLGLWAAVRAGVDVPNQTLQKATQWLIKTQLGEGSFAYQPASGEKADQRGPRYSTTVAGVSALLLVRHLFYQGVPFGEDLGEAAGEPKKKFGVLEKMQDQPTKKGKGGEFTMSVGTLDKAITRGLRVVDQRWSTGPASPLNCHLYLLYTFERTAALLDSEMIGTHDWYAEASDTAVKYQLADGSWTDYTGPAPATSFAIMCLSKTTAKIMGKTPEKKVGGGLLAGARGLPGDLSKIQLKDGQAQDRKSKGAVDDLLSELEKVQEVAVADVQKAILESVDLDDPEKLVGAVDTLKRLAVDPRAEVRRTALWAIGRSGEIRLAPLLITGLGDEDPDVIREASFGLTVLSRKPTGLVTDKGKAIPVEPLDLVEEGVSDAELQEAIRKWQATAIPAWKSWYHFVRPYDERDDRGQLQRKK